MFSEESSNTVFSILFLEKKGQLWGSVFLKRVVHKEVAKLDLAIPEQESAFRSQRQITFPIPVRSIRFVLERFRLWIRLFQRLQFESNNYQITQSWINTVLMNFIGCGLNRLLEGIDRNVQVVWSLYSSKSFIFVIRYF